MTHWRDSTDTRTLRDAVAALKRVVEAAYWDCRDDDAGSAHDDLLTAEWRLRQSERKTGK